MANAAMAIQVLPQTTNTTELLQIVDAAIAEIDSTGLSYEVGAFETTVEGDLEELVMLIPAIQKACVAAGAQMISNYIKLSYAPQNHILTTDEKLKKYRP
ncbi:thiamine-binding protein [Leuconostoc fallax]|uniref:Thiamine-binding protein domain-containing protein n=1 Tax=Leuconostoc fallax TaxID=1251 RepID=A0A4R5N780_9LACO|nr:thiamine-binding protein [Leuconostoc fallax]MBU7455282.1 thiamine-binding protein [Leuconostoc fallax]MCO6183536.1 thiamine-binding protein [Leuconostoc fallax]TDG67609.1 hypothetical protein C5L23_001408 [Leuconostoc fallax]